MAYDENYRKRAIAFKQDDHSFRELRKVLGISPNTYYQWVSLQETGSLTHRTSPGRPAKIDMAALKQAVEARNDLYLRELADIFDCSVVAVFKALGRADITLKKDLHLHRKI
jgi:transposase